MIPVKHTVLLPISVAALLLTAQPVVAQVKNAEQLTADINALQSSLNTIQNDMQGLRRLLDNRGMLELFQRMDDLANEVSQLRGQLEEQQHDLAGIKKRQRELYLDIDRRLRELEITSSRAPVAAAPATTQAPPVDTPAAPADSAPAAVVPVVTAPVVTPPASSDEPTPSEPVAPVAAQPVSEERDAYQKAFDMLKEGRYKMANTAFREFLEKYPQSSYAGNAQYWLGESNYVTRDFDQAIIEFQEVMSKYGSSNKVPDAMLKLGYTYYELRRFNDARVILERLQQEFPNGTHARLAGKRLLRMKREGH
jgi:tol-pal system protein YbgF